MYGGGCWLWDTKGFGWRGGGGLRGEAYGVLYSAMLGVVDRRDGYGVLAVWG